MNTSSTLWILIVLISLPIATARAESTPEDAARNVKELKRQEAGLEQMHTDRRRNVTELERVQDNASEGRDTLAEDKESQKAGMQALESANRDLLIGQKQQQEDRDTHTAAVNDLGSTHVKTIEAGRNATRSREAAKTLQANKKTLEAGVDNRRLTLHNDRSDVRRQKQAVDSAARYVADDDARILRKEEKVKAAQQRVTNDDRGTHPTSPTDVTPR